MARKAWDSLSASYRRRLRTAWGDQARARYEAGDKLTRAQRGHRFTPQTPEQALAHPELYPRYVARNQDRLNALARQRGEREHGTGPRGHGVTSYAETGDYTWVVPAGTLLPDYHPSTQFRSLAEAQLEARRSNAPAGTVIIVDEGEGVEWRYVLYFGYGGAPTAEDERKARRKRARARKGRPRRKG